MHSFGGLPLLEINLGRNQAPNHLCPAIACMLLFPPTHFHQNRRGCWNQNQNPQGLDRGAAKPWRRNVRRRNRFLEALIEESEQPFAQAVSMGPRGISWIGPVGMGESLTSPMRSGTSGERRRPGGMS